MTDDAKASDSCPYCSGPVESGFVQSGVRWMAGEPTLASNAGSSGELLREQSFWVGGFLRGQRCKRCQKLILSY